ncbi:hypothetical protein K7432_012323 [Basidiobolus ranarum]|uniref:Caprin-1 dimerization domain-containing protein n=1 Tax=Basidiobolus ranarum TaxID=34480 RepID=A0ABR2VSF6_9FUNG
MFASKIENNQLNSTLKEVSKPVRHENPYIESVLKRLRTLKKRWSKIERYDEVINSSPEGKSELIPDQIQAWEKKDEVSSAIKELEDIVKQFTIIDAEETKTRLAQAKEQERQLKKSTRKITLETEASGARILFDTVGLFHGVYNIAPTCENISEAERIALSHFKDIIISKFDSEEDIEVKQKEIFHYLKKMNNHSEDEISEMAGVHFQDIASLLNTLISPPKKPEVIVEEESVEELHGIEFSTEDLEHVHYDGDDTVVIHEVIVPPGGISFMSISEIDNPVFKPNGVTDESNSSHDTVTNGLVDSTSETHNTQEIIEESKVVQNSAPHHDQTESVSVPAEKHENQHRGGHRGGYRGRRNNNGQHNTGYRGRGSSDGSRRGGNRSRGGRNPNNDARGKGQSHGNRSL